MLPIRWGFAGLLLLACSPVLGQSRSGQNRATAQASGQRFQAAEVSLDGVELKPGVSRVQVLVERRPRELVLSVPKIETGDRRPLVVFLHGASSAEFAERMIHCLLQPSFASVAPILVAPLSATAQWWTQQEAGYVLGLVDAAIRAWPVRPQRIVVVGYSDGGIGAWAYIRLYPETFSAAIPMASNHTVIGPTTRPVYAIHGEDDELFDVQQIREQVELLQRDGIDVTFSVKPGGKHLDACSYRPELREAANWLFSHAWSKSGSNKRTRTPTVAPSIGQPSFGG